MIAKLCAAQRARQIVRALHVNAPEHATPPEIERSRAKPKKTKARKKRKAA